VATTEEKLDVVLKEMKVLQLSHAKVATTGGDLATWIKAAEKISEEMQAEVKALTSHIVALEATTTAERPKVLPREEEGQAKGHNERPLLHGDSSMGKSLDFTLGNGEKNILKTAYFEYDIPEHEHKSTPALITIMTIEITSCLRLIFPNLMGNTLECGEKNARSTLLCIMSQCMFGSLLPQLTLR
jgi:hypothetical protein